MRTKGSVAQSCLWPQSDHGSNDPIPRRPRRPTSRADAVTALVLASLVLVVVTAFAGHLMVAQVAASPRVRALLSPRPPLPPRPLPLAAIPHWTALDDQQVARYLKESRE